MFQKILHEEEFDLLQPGSFVIQFPVSSDPQNEIDLSDEENFVLYEVHSINSNEDAVVLTIPVHPFLDGHAVHPNDSTHPGKTIGKQKSDMIKESVWWYRADE